MNDKTAEAAPGSAPPGGYVRLVCEILWLMLSMPVMLMGCVAGWMFGAFMSGVNQGLGDWKKWNL